MVPVRIPMFTELSTRQTTGEPCRRWFTSVSMDLVVWFGQDGALQAFHLCYGKPLQERALTWRAGAGFAHLTVDDGSPESLGHKSTPVLQAVDGLSPGEVRSAFLAATNGLPATVVTTVQQRLDEYAGDRRAG
ncbi:MAG: hypothetical protein K0S16_823 [Moraxellaceae bacterium]|nr:hypothetical protein [Moraxellaceae bacterium]